MLEDKLWNDILSTIETGQIVWNFKGKKSSKVIDITTSRIYFQVESNGTIIFISKTTISNILNKLLENGSIRQLEAGKDPRISLGLLMLLPYFTEERRGRTKYLTWAPLGRETLLNS